MSKIRLGDILVQNKVLTSEQLERALHLQQQSGCALGEAAVQLGFASEEAIAVCIAKQLGIPYASRENGILLPEPTQHLEKLVPEEFARTHLLLPLFLHDQILAVAMADPTDVLTEDNLRLMSGKSLQPFISTKAQILAMIDAFYQGDHKKLLDRAMQRPSTSSDAELLSTEEVETSDERLDLDKMTAQAQGAQVVQLVNLMLKQAISERASDIHLESFEGHSVLRFRIDGVLYERTAPAMDVTAAIVSRVKILSKLDIAERRLPQDGSFSLKIQNRLIDVRVSTLPTVFGEKLVMRILDKGTANLELENLGLEPNQMEDLLKAGNYPHGLIFLTGPTGSGKSTTLYSLLQCIKTNKKNFLTVEDPVEYKILGINQVQVKPQIGLTFAGAVRAFLRQDPDVILVGEVRDQETAQTCLRAALTGHLVLSTLHTNDALGAVIRLVDLGIEPFLLASSLVMVGAQRLIRVLCPHCKQPYSPDPALMEKAYREALLPRPSEPAVFFKPQGCEKCVQTGFLGRQGIYEVFLVDETMRSEIHHGKDLKVLRGIVREKGWTTLTANGWRKVIQGLTVPEEVYAATLISEV